MYFCCRYLQYRRGETLIAGIAINERKKKETVVISTRVMSHKGLQTLGALGSEPAGQEHLITSFFFRYAVV